MIQQSTPTAVESPPGDFVRTVALYCAVAILWLTTRPYFGVVFDARFYMLEALNALDHARFANDLYLKFGSQGSFTLFTKLYLPFFRAFGVGTTGIILTVAGQLLWLFGLFRLARALVGGRLMWLSIAVVVGMLQLYAGGFGYGEAYVTARLYAEGLVMLGLALLASRPLWTAALLIVAAAIHPLMALPGIAIAFVYMALGRPIWWAVMVAGMGMAAALGLAGIAPFSNLFRTIDPAWFAVINLRSPHCLLLDWPADDFTKIAAVVAWGVAALVMADAGHRRFLAATLLVGVGGLICAFLGGDIAHNVLAVELQPWRSMWLLQIVSRIYVPVVFMAVLAKTRLDSFHWATLLTLGLILSSNLARFEPLLGSASFVASYLALVAAALALMALHLLVKGRRHRPMALVSATAGLTLVAVALSQWDLRSPWIRYLESPEPPPKDLLALLPDNASVYWEGGLDMLWLRMRRASYFSCDQGTGVVFHRQTAMAYKHRSDSFASLHTSDFDQSESCKGFGKMPKPERNRSGLQNLCRREPSLDYVVLTSPLAGVEGRAWKSPIRFEDVRATGGIHFAVSTDRFYIYPCASVR